MESELALCAGARDSRAPHAADRRLPAPHRRPRLWRGHYYSDKAPGASLLALAPVEAARVVSRAAGVDPASFPGIAWTSYVAAVVTSAAVHRDRGACRVLAVAEVGRLAAAALFARRRLRPRVAGLGLRDAVHGAWPDRRLSDDRASPPPMPSATPQTRQRRGWRGCIGLAGGWAVVTEFQAAVPALFIGLLAIARLNPSRDATADAGSAKAPAERQTAPARRAGFSRTAVIVRMALGVTLAAIPLLIYNALAFGSPFHLGYASEEGFQEMQPRLLRHHLSDLVLRRASSSSASTAGCCRWRRSWPSCPSAWCCSPDGDAEASAPSWSPASACSTCFSTPRTSTGKAAGLSARVR